MNSLLSIIATLAAFVTSKDLGQTKLEKMYKLES